MVNVLFCFVTARNIGGWETLISGYEIQPPVFKKIANGKGIAILNPQIVLPQGSGHDFLGSPRCFLEAKFSVVINGLASRPALTGPMAKIVPASLEKMAAPDGRIAVQTIASQECLRLKAECISLVS